MAMRRGWRRFNVVVVFILLNALFWTGVYFAFLKAPETCFDAKQNQNEQGIDCGGVCANVCFVAPVTADIEVKEVAFVLGGSVVGGSSQYDVMATIENPNDAFGASSFDYTFELKNKEGQALVTRTGKGAILPRAEKKLMELNLETAELPESISLTLNNAIWERSSGYREQPKVSIYQKRYERVSSGFGFGKASGRLSNESAYDFRSISIYVTLYDATGKLLALNKTKQDTIRSGESRDFELVWPLPFSGEVDRVEMEIDPDVYNSANFIKQYFPGGGYR